MDAIRLSLKESFPAATDAELDAAVNSVLAVLNAPWYPLVEKRVTGAEMVNGRSSPSGATIATVKKGTALRAGIAERGWVPCLLHIWISGELLSGS